MTLQLPSLTWRSSPNYSSRGGQAVRLVVAHDCEGSFLGSASWFAMTKSQVSAHIVLSDDGQSAIQMVRWANKAWHVCNFNPFSEGIEAAGYAAKGLGAPEWQALANIVAFRLHANSLPCQVATASNDWVGFCEHANLGVAGGGHHDITDDAGIWASFVKLVQDAYGAPQQTSWVPLGAPSIPNTLPAGFIPSATARHDLQPPSIEWCQMVLNKLQLVPVPLTVDGMAGKATDAAVEAFQTKNGLTVDGEIGPNTIAALKKAA
jgi:peptidoglycan hydrolase-like protein with peptidoglycan-binding domain